MWYTTMQGSYMNKEQLNKLQIAQLEHDERFPREITYLDIQPRLVHMCLHFAKYYGTIVDQMNQPHTDEPKLKQAMVDMFIICLTSANILNLRLSDHIDGIVYGLSIESAYVPLAVSIGKFAKALESLDHLEAFNYKEVMCDSVVTIAQCLINITHFDLAGEVPYRLNVVQNRSIFKNKLKTHEERLRDYGYAEGGYASKCSKCKGDMWAVDKRAVTCKSCAEALLEAEGEY